MTKICNHCSWSTPKADAYHYQLIDSLVACLWWQCGKKQDRFDLEFCTLSFRENCRRDMFGPYVKSLVPMIGHRFCSLLSLPCDTIRRFIHEKFRGFAANLDGLVTTRGLFEEVGANFLLLSPDTSAATK